MVVSAEERELLERFRLMPPAMQQAMMTALRTDDAAEQRAMLAELEAARQ